MDTEHPERNGPVLIYQANLESKVHTGSTKTLHRSYVILHPADPRFFIEEPSLFFYRGKLTAPNVITFRVPAMQYSLSYDTMSVQASNLSTDAQEGIVTAGRTFLDYTQPTFWKDIVLKFPDGDNLSSAAVNVFDEDDPRDVLAMEIMELPPIRVSGRQKMGVEHFAVFKVARLDQEPIREGINIDG